MTNGSINIDDIKGKVAGISHGSTGSLSAENITIQGNLTIVINNPTKEIIAELRKIQVPIETSDTRDHGITTQRIKETRQSINWFKDLVSRMDKKVGKPTLAIRAGNVEVSRNELFWKDAATIANEYFRKGERTHLKSG
jgi:hypothetical protein